jgi:hypothetical protein
VSSQRYSHLDALVKVADVTADPDYQDSSESDQKQVNIVRLIVLDTSE